MNNWDRKKGIRRLGESLDGNMTCVGHLIGRVFMFCMVLEAYDAPEGGGVYRSLGSG